MADLARSLEQLANRGHPRGAAEVFRRATEIPPRRTPRHTPLIAIAASIVALIVVGALVVVRDGPQDNVTTVAGASGPALLARYGASSIIIGDPVTGTERTVPGVAHNCGCQLAVRGDVIWGADLDGAFYLKAPYETVVRVDIGGSALDIFPADTPGDVYVTKRLANTGGADAVRRITANGQPVGDFAKPPAPYRITDPPRAVTGGVLVTSDGAELRVWNATNDDISEPLVSAEHVIDTYITTTRSLIAYRTNTALAIFDTTTRISVDFAPIDGATGYLRGGAFSPDGHYLLAFAANQPRLGQAVLINLDDSTRTPLGRLTPYGEDVGWASWDPSGTGAYFAVIAPEHVDLTTLDVAAVPLTGTPMTAVPRPSTTPTDETPRCPGATAQSTKGTMPSPRAGATQADPADIPDFISYVGNRDEPFGYVPAQGILNRPPSAPPVPVCDTNLDRLIGYAHAGRGFVPLGTDPATVPTTPVNTASGRAETSTSRR